MVTLREGEQPLEQYEMVLFICNSFLPQLGYLMPATSASLIMYCLFYCALSQLISGILKSRKCKFNNVVRVWHSYLIFVNFGPPQHYLAL